MVVGPVSVTGPPGVGFLLTPERKPELIARLEGAGAVAATAEDARVVRVENGVPRHCDDFGEQALPQETQQASRAVSFTKGCYLGQEIVERIRARGHVHRVLAKVEIDGEEPPATGSAVLAGGQEIGHLTSPVYSRRLRWSLGLAILAREFTAPGTAVNVGGRPGRVLDQKS